MTLIRCPECKKQISDIAQQCPYCGCCDFTPKPKEEISKKKLLFFLLFPVIMAIVAINLQNNRQSPSYSYASVQRQNTTTSLQENLPDEAVSAPQENLPEENIGEPQENLPEETIEAPQQNDEPTFEDMGL